MRKNYDQDFKDEAVGIALNNDRPYCEIALDLGVNYQTFGNWMRKAMSTKNNRPSKGASAGAGVACFQEVLALRKQEIVLLKKAAAYFAKEHV